MHAQVLTGVYVLLATATVAQSRRWFAPEVSCWITQKKVPASWEDAQRRCEVEGAVLASPLNTQLWNYMQSLINMHNHTAAYFLGTRANRSDDGQEVHYISVEGKQLDDMPRTVYDAIDQLDIAQGDCLSMDRHGIRAVSCWDHLPYICYSNETTECGSVPPVAPLPTTSTTTSAPLPSTTVVPGYTYYPATGSYYMVHRSRASWYEANSTCVSEGAHLVVLNDVAEMRAVASHVWGNVSDYTSTWIGLRDDRPGGAMEWRTVRGEALSEVYYKWIPGRPLNDKAWLCAGLRSDKLLYDSPCDNKYYFTCEKYAHTVLI